MRDLIREAWRGLSAHPLRTGLTMLGIGWGLFAEMMMLSLGVGLYDALHKEFGKTGAERAAFYPQTYQANAIGPPKIKRVQLQPEDVEALRTHATLLKSVEPEFRIGERPVRAGETVTMADVYGVTPTVAPVRNFWMQSGRFFTPGDMEACRRVCTLGADVARKLELTAPGAVGQRVVIDGVALTIIGIMGAHPDQMSRMHSADDEQVYVPLETARRHFVGTEADYWTVNFEPVRPELYDQASTEVRSIVAARQAFDPANEQAAWVYGIFDDLKFVYYMTMSLKLFLGVAGAVTVFVGGVGVMNIMSVAIAERTNEIGLRKALGATPRDLFWQFFVEALVMTGVAAGIAFGLGLGIMLVCAQFTMPTFVPAPTMSPGLALFLFALTVAVGIFAGTRPALRAARMQPAQALRFT